MKSIINTGKRSVIAILTLCILLGNVGTCLNVTAMAAEEIAVALEATTVVTEESTAIIEDTTVVVAENAQELVPMMATGCGDLQSWYDIDHETKASILGEVSGNWRNKVGNNPDIYYDRSGKIVLCGTGSYRGKTYPTDLLRSWFI